MSQNKLIFVVAYIIGFTLCCPIYGQDTMVDYMNHIKSLMYESRNKNAIEELDAFLQRDSTNINILYYLGLNYEEISDYYNASKYLGLANKYQPGNIKIIEPLGRNYFYCGMFNEAENILSIAEKMDPSNYRIQLLVGKVLMSENKWAEADNAFSKVIESDSTNGYVFQLLGECNSHLNNIDKAVKYYRLAYKYNPLNMDVMFNLISLLFRKEQTGELLTIINEGLQHYQTSIVLWKWKGDVYRSLFNYDTANYCYKKALGFGDTSGYMLKNVGVCFYWLKNYSLAEQYLEKSIEVNSKDYEAFFYLGAAFKNQNKLENALKYFKQADTLLQNESLADIYIQIGSVYQLLGNSKEALEYYMDALREYPLNNNNYFYAASMYDKLKKNKDALNYYKIFLSNTDSNDPKLINYAKNRIKGLIK